MKIKHVALTQSDNRGTITDILVKERIDYVTLITSAKGSIRGNHFHKKTIQWVYILTGRLEFIGQMPNAKVIRKVLQPGDLAMTPAFERHAMVALDNASFIVFTRGVRGGKNYEKDTYRLTKPLAKARQS